MDSYIDSFVAVSENNFRLKLKSVEHMKNIPLIERGFNFAEGYYNQAKNSNALLNWSLETAELSLKLASTASRPVTVLLERPIKAIDQQIYKNINRCQFAQENIVDERCIRVSNEVLKHVEQVLSVMEMYVEQHLPKDYYDHISKNEANTAEKVMNTINHICVILQKFELSLIHGGFKEIKNLTQRIVHNLYIIVYIIALIPIDCEFALKKYEEFVNSHKISIFSLKEVLNLPVDLEIESYWKN